MSAACIAPAGHWCNGTTVGSISAGAKVTRMRRGLEVGGCCCAICVDECASSTHYNCGACTGAATWQCASCYYAAEQHHEIDGHCFPSPPWPPMFPPAPPYPPSLPPSMPLPHSPIPPPLSTPMAMNSSELTTQHDHPDGGCCSPALATSRGGIFVPITGTLACLAMFLLVLRSIVFCRMYGIHRRRLSFASRGAMISPPPTVATLDLSHLPTWRTPPHEPNGATEALECAICLSAYMDGEEVMQLPCKHQFHSKCIHSWLNVNKACPTCPLCKAYVGLSQPCAPCDIQPPALVDEGA